MDLFDVIKRSLWNTGTAKADRAVYDEMDAQKIQALAAPILNELSLEPELMRIWKLAVLSQIGIYTRYQYMQASLPVTVPYVILKGTSAAQYYPDPQYRTMGDIDIMTRREDFEAAYQQFLDDGYTIIKNLQRETGFAKNGFIVELHRYFASLNDPAQAKYLDDQIIEHINPSHVLPDDINGLVLLEHISQHLENGLGLRQIIDWMMYVDKCLPDEKWEVFSKLADNIGLKTLAITVTRMCEIYLGLPERKWCATADESLCAELMDYVLSCGDFGSKWTEDRDTGIRVFTLLRSPKVLFSTLQKGGINHLNKARSSLLRPFAWIYQAGRYTRKGLGRKHAGKRLVDEFRSAQKRNAMFDALGVKQKTKGLVVFRDGEYVKD